MKKFLVSSFSVGFLFGMMHSKSVAIELYGKKITSTVCVGLLASQYSLTPKLVTAPPGVICRITSDAGSIYLLYEDDQCTTPVYFVGN